jgi:hypothetical protein
MQKCIAMKGLRSRIGKWPLWVNKRQHLLVLQVRTVDQLTAKANEFLKAVGFHH